MADITPPTEPSTELSTTPDQKLRVPDGNERIEHLDWIIQLLALDIEKKLVKVYEDVNERADKDPAPGEGTLTWLKDVNELQIYDGSNWVRVYPTSPRIYTGTANPNAGLGQVGDIYIQHT